MAVLALDHVNIRTPEPERTAGFFRDALGMDARPSPGRETMELGAWIYDETGRAVVHIAAADSAYPSDDHRPFIVAQGSGAIHHVALRCADYAGTKARLDRLALDHWENAVPSIRLRQIFVPAPTDILFELNFADD